MSNYATLKAAITAAIKQNGNKEITGNLLQQQLLAMVNSLGAGYQYAGIATPATNPGTPDQNVFYIAGTPGVYSNFNSETLEFGQIAIFKYNGSWTRTNVVDNGELYPYRCRRFYVNGAGYAPAAIAIDTTAKTVTLPAGLFRISSGRTLSSVKYVPTQSPVITEFVGTDFQNGASVGLYATFENSSAAVYLVEYSALSTFISQHSDIWELGRGIISTNTEEFSISAMGKVTINGVAADMPTGGLSENDIINNCYDGGAQKTLSAEQGKFLYPYRCRIFMTNNNSGNLEQRFIEINTNTGKVTTPAGRFRIQAGPSLASFVSKTNEQSITTDFYGSISDYNSGASVGLYAVVGSNSVAVYLVVFTSYSAFVSEFGISNIWELGRGVVSINSGEFNMQLAGEIKINGRLFAPKMLLQTADIVNNCKDGGTEKPLSAEQGKFLFPYLCRNFYVNIPGSTPQYSEDFIYIDTYNKKVKLQNGRLFRISGTQSLSSLKYFTVSGGDIETNFVPGTNDFVGGASVGLYAVFNGSTLNGIYLVDFSGLTQFLSDNSAYEIWELGRGIIDTNNRLSNFISANGPVCIDGVKYNWDSRLSVQKNFGKTIGVFGGSLSVNTESKAAKDIWREKLSCQITDYGEGGAGFSLLQKGSGGHSIQEQTDLAASKDVYILWASTNDFTNSRQIGNYTDYTAIDNYDESKLETQCGGINYCIKKLLTINPNAEIYFFTSLRFFTRDSGYNPFSNDVNSIGKTFAEYVEAQKKCCEYYGIPILDQFNLQGVNVFNYSEYYTNDNLHINESGYKKIGYIQAEFLANGK